MVTQEDNMPSEMSRPKRPVLDVSEQEIRGQLEISADLQAEFKTQAAYFARWAFLHARAQDFARQIEEKVEVSFYELYNEYRKKHSDAKENECKSYVRTHNQHQQYAAALRKAQFQADILKAAMRAFEMRRDMLIQLGAQSRAEGESTDLKVAARKATRVVNDSRRGRRDRNAEDES